MFGILTMLDGYKTGHRVQYPEGTSLVYSNWTPRGSRIAGVDHVVFCSLQPFMQEFLIEEFNKFFAADKDTVIKAYKRRLDNYLGAGVVSVDDVAALHDLQYVPLIIRALDEGTRVPLGVPMFTVENTVSDFFWLTNRIETLASTCIWQPCTAATIAYENRKVLEHFTHRTGGNEQMVNYLAHDFSMRGMVGLHGGAASGAAHLFSGYGTDTLPAIDYLEHYYYADSDNEIVGQGVPATEHSVTCMGGSSKDQEKATYWRLMTEVYPSGDLSLVFDSWDFWYSVETMLPELKSDIMARDGKVIIRPDSGDPVLILCGDPAAHPSTPQYKGLIQCLWDIFGGTTNSLGFKTLDSHIGAIYGDSITSDRMREILERLAGARFASDNVVFGVGSYSYQYNTRDTFGFAIKATAGIVNGEAREIFKDPKTDDGTKRSAKGFIRVDRVDGELVAVYPVSQEESKKGEMKVVFDGKLEQSICRPQTLSQIRKLLHPNAII